MLPFKPGAASPAAVQHALFLLTGTLSCMFLSAHPSEAAQSVYACVCLCVCVCVCVAGYLGACVRLGV